MKTKLIIVGIVLLGIIGIVIMPKPDGKSQFTEKEIESKNDSFRKDFFLTKPTRLLPLYSIKEWIFDRKNYPFFSHKWNVSVKVKSPSSNDHYSDYYENDADYLQIRDYSEYIVYSPNYDYDVNISNFYTSASCGSAVEDYHCFFVKKGNEITTAGTFSLKPGKMPPPRQGSLNKINGQTQMAQNHRVNYIKINAVGEDLEFKVKVPNDSKFYNLEAQEVSGDDGTLYYLMKIIMRAGENDSLEDTTTISNFNINRHLVLIFWNDGDVFDSTACYYKHGAFKLY